jgi:hypothetical protein
MTDSEPSRKRRAPVPLRLSLDALDRADEIRAMRANGERRHAVLVEAVDVGLHLLKVKAEFDESAREVNEVLQGGPDQTRALNRAARSLGRISVEPNFKGGKKSTSPAPKPRPALGSDPGKLSS